MWCVARLRGVRFGQNGEAGFGRVHARACCVAMLVAIATVLGCGGGGASIQGNVTFDGQPVEKGSIVFEPADGLGQVAGGTIENGKYHLDSKSQLTPGPMIVRITAARSTGKKVPAGPPAPDGTMVDEIKQYIPKVYNEQSQLTAQIESSSKTQNFELQSQ
jgi:hypothetical protein